MLRILPAQIRKSTSFSLHLDWTGGRFYSRGTRANPSVRGLSDNPGPSGSSHRNSRHLLSFHFELRILWAPGLNQNSKGVPQMLRVRQSLKLPFALGRPFDSQRSDKVSKKLRLA